MEKKIMIYKPPSCLSSPLKMTFPFSNKILSLFIKDNGVIEVSYPTNNYSFHTSIPLKKGVISNPKNINNNRSKNHYEPELAGFNCATRLVRFVSAVDRAVN